MGNSRITWHRRPERLISFSSLLNAGFSGSFAKTSPSRTFQSGFKGLFCFFRSSTSFTFIYVSIEVRSRLVGFLPRSFLIFRRIRIPVIQAEATEMMIRTPSVSRKFHDPCQCRLETKSRIGVFRRRTYKEFSRFMLIADHFSLRLQAGSLVFVDLQFFAGLNITFDLSHVNVGTARFPVTDNDLPRQPPVGTIITRTFLQSRC